MEKALPSDVWNILLHCSNVAQKNGIRIYLVGGVVRDLILSREVFDVDITVEGNAIEFAKLLNGEIVQKQEDLKTAKVRFENGIETDFASTRKEIYPRKGHLPVVTEIGCDLQEDILRRDFTINAMALSLNADFGDLYDYSGGFQDLKDKKLKILHDESFSDDPSRIIRGLKFSVRLGFELDEDTKFQQEKYLQNPNRDISISRIKSELEQTFALKEPLALEIFFKNKMYRIYTDIAHSPKKFLRVPAIVSFGCILQNEMIVEDFNFTKNEKNILLKAIEFVSSYKIFDDDFELYKFFENAEIPSVLIYYARTGDEKALYYIENLSNIKPLINGNDLIDAGFLPGKQFADIFDEIIREKLIGNLQTKEEELHFLMKKKS